MVLPQTEEKFRSLADDIAKLLRFAPTRPYPPPTPSLVLVYVCPYPPRTPSLVLMYLAYPIWCCNSFDFGKRKKEKVPMYGSDSCVSMLLPQHPPQAAQAQGQTGQVRPGPARKT
eukprot:1524999-Rhodomonas_salina.1